MELNGRPLWQVGTGDTERSYADLCLAFDVMMVGPGKLGPFAEDLYADLGDIRNSIRRFYQEAHRGDLVLLRLGTGRVTAVGVIEDDHPEHLDTFGDVDGWDLHHVRRVRWLPNSSHDFPLKTLGGQVRTFAAVNVVAVLDWVAQLHPTTEDLTRPLAALPPGPPSLGRSDLGRLLFTEGLPSQTVDRVLSTIASLDRVATWYSNELKRPEGRPSEHETVAYLVIPLLFALGWSEQTAAIEWQQIDVALFRQMPANDSNLNVVVEAKLLNRSVFQPFGQARDYALKTGREGVSRLIVTDGIRYTVHLRSENTFKLSAYLNLLDMRPHYPLYECRGAAEAILLMAKDAT